ncbi:bacillithiol biosynthesis protein BshC [Roseisolibacter agri]|uniref:bacillithiol biosynthesis protein BshC n=1 Tax=Roseisolibacter agri TaxID=2014610 RepID=UPI0024E09B8C|nr:bacillithiol biosynthesis BshC [Roseisolibacter agri]
MSERSHASAAPARAPGPATSPRADVGVAVRTEPLGGSPLARAALAGTLPHAWYPPMPTGTAEWRLHADAVRLQFSAGAWFELLRPAFDVSGEAAARLERSAAGAGIVVTTGQQPGLFGGPLYTLSKAISARALADALEERTGLPVAPVFWAATDDADFEEARGTVVALDGAVRTLRLEAEPIEGTPMSAVPMGDDVRPLFDVLARAAGSAAFVEALDAARAAYVPGATVGDAYVRLLRALLEPLGIAVIDASHPAVREAGFNLLRRALMQSAAIETALAQRTAAIEAAGFAPQVPDVAGRTLVFRDDADGRKARVAVADARAIVPSVKRGSLGPNVLLRPVMERSILPTVAYVAGPGEYAYFAQVSAVATALGVPQPLAVPRWSVTIVEPHVRRALDHLGLDVDDLRHPHAPEADLARRAMPAAVSQALDAVRDAVARATDALREHDEARALLPAPAVEGAARSLEHRIQRLERRYLAALKRRDDVETRALAVARSALFPDGVRQERALNALPLVARHGPALLDAMLAAARTHADALVDGTTRA